MALDSKIIENQINMIYLLNCLCVSQLNGEYLLLLLISMLTGATVNIYIPITSRYCPSLKKHNQTFNSRWQVKYFVFVVQSARDRWWLFYIYMYIYIGIICLVKLTGWHLFCSLGQCLLTKAVLFLLKSSNIDMSA